ncbi:MAG: Crp/Fnr family transcriptional regulator [Parvibaculum sp.]|jgi:CRP-like cAMP-binding protein|uniref:cyclic nucleotide-binding domain-containing protein n=1 Tax=Parvibaculum sp. TaxID=2024848 RepID=UPI000CC2E5E9|nr:Crp/Fnr family transcriptional regulator [Parvibaculum sp.]MDZ4381100.1 Crp/Fnr family transcriptional regulator [Parvibaculum sp.]PKP77490.1 MAG: cyclic nucleotide-binding protein [Alphaproteobacteria bacterium HGW-Alphaproteobacteria-3]
MSLEPVIALLQRLDLFAGLDPVRLEVVAFTCERREYEPGETLFEADEEADCAWLILEGEAAMLAEGEGGPPRALRLDTGDLIGETALFNRERRRTRVRAVTRLLTLRIGRDMFQRLLGEFPEMAGAVAARLANRLDDAGADLRVLQMRFDRSGKKSGKQKE